MRRLSALRRMTSPWHVSNRIMAFIMNGAWIPVHRPYTPSTIRRAPICWIGMASCGQVSLMMLNHKPLRMRCSGIWSKSNAHAFTLVYQNWNALLRYWPDDGRGAAGATGHGLAQQPACPAPGLPALSVYRLGNADHHGCRLLDAAQILERQPAW